MYAPHVVEVRVKSPCGSDGSSDFLGAGVEVDDVDAGMPLQVTYSVSGRDAATGALGVHTFVRALRPVSAECAENPPSSGGAVCCELAASPDDPGSPAAPTFQPLDDNDGGDDDDDASLEERAAHVVRDVCVLFRSKSRGELRACGQGLQGGAEVVGRPTAESLGVGDARIGSAEPVVPEGSAPAGAQPAAGSVTKLVPADFAFAEHVSCAFVAYSASFRSSRPIKYKYVRAPPLRASGFAFAVRPGKPKSSVAAVLLSDQDRVEAGTSPGASARSVELLVGAEQGVQFRYRGRVVARNGAAAETAGAFPGHVHGEDDELYQLWVQWDDHAVRCGAGAVVGENQLLEWKWAVAGSGARIAWVGMGSAGESVDIETHQNCERHAAATLQYGDDPALLVTVSLVRFVRAFELAEYDDHAAWCARRGLALATVRGQDDQTLAVSMCETMGNGRPLLPNCFMFVTPFPVHA